MRGWRLSRLLALALLPHCLCAAGVTFRYFYDDANELFRVLDSTGTLVEYDYDPAGNITQVARSTVPPASLAILNITPLSGTTGQTITIYGQNFSAVAAGDLVQFGGVTATVVSASSGTLVVQVPAGFTSGTVTVTVNGVTASSGSLSFVPPPSITSISPLYGNIGQTLNGVVVQGFNLAGATFSLSGGGTITPVSLNSTQATVNITLGTTPGTYIMVATTSSGSSSTQTGAGNFFIVYNSPGNNYTDSLFSTFNAMGTTPLFPPGTNEVDATFSVFNAMGTTPLFPPGTNETDATFSVFNAMGTTPLFPPGTNYTDQLFSVFNAMGATPLYPPGSNEAWQLFSTQNTESGGAAQVVISMNRTRRPAGPIAVPGGPAPGARPPLHLIAGETVQLSVTPSVFLHGLELDAGKATLASSITGALNVPFTAPFGVESLELKAFGYTANGAISDSLVETVDVSADPGRTVSGRVVDANGSPVPGAIVTWQAEGLAAEYYRMGGELRAVPELKGGAARMAFLGALNYPNPQEVFGADPMGVGLGRNYAAKLAGKIQIAAEGVYQFGLLAHQGARLSIDGELIVEAVATGDDAVTAMGTANLTVGAHDIEVTHFESGGAAALQLLWTPPGGAPAVVPPSLISSEAPALWRAVTGSDGRFALQVPAALDGVVVKLVTGEGTVHIDR